MSELSERETRVYGKLVRDGIPQIIEDAGDESVHRALGEAEYVPALLSKVSEEAAELLGAAPEERMGELADLYEVITALTAALGYTWDDLQSAAAKKREARGGFEQRLWLEAVRIGR